VRPAQIADVAEVRRLPTLLGALFALAMAAGFALGISAATRARRRELALLRALGCSGRQLAASVRWHAVTVVAVAAVVGGTLGIALGRSLYRSFAEDLAVVTTPLISVPWTAGVALAAIAVGLLAAVVPGHRSSRLPVSEVLRRD
jgi:putative ABC transport system permease protein